MYLCNGRLNLLNSRPGDETVKSVFKYQVCRCVPELIGIPCLSTCTVTFIYKHIYFYIYFYTTHEVVFLSIKQKQTSRAPCSFYKISKDTLLFSCPIH